MVFCLATAKRTRSEAIARIAYRTALQQTI